MAAPGFTSTREILYGLQKSKSRSLGYQVKLTNWLSAGQENGIVLLARGTGQIPKGHGDRRPGACPEITK